MPTDGNRGAPGDRPESVGGCAQRGVLIVGQLDIGGRDVALELLDARSVMRLYAGRTASERRPVAR
jgi:hypothetical protein